MHIFLLVLLFAVVPHSKCYIASSIPAALLKDGAVNQENETSLNLEVGSDQSELVFENGDVDECKQLPTTMLAFYDLCLKLGGLIIHYKSLVAGPLQTLINCEMNNPLLWTKCVLHASQEVMTSAHTLQIPTYGYAKRFKALHAELANEYKACLKAWLS